ncbi:spermidine synthase [Streptoalloteichus tenebrarius]|uniref:Polyamine aminopropyltransferase n=1 Tax=Streptoalloteichus tenebrarius (strain ATCC 17920 / DSM 40477 / JCM 4838 / CBS 697.72 / NBRC 16177 / NCIMB 11028 / NRRL B-12390 / A12253. 1 / ISP 5477) TaxID=1933 RepID=A0ABT1HV05_STRSD|nr:hypothetical protein [Streptoalloteichus tenebrarius]MCP2259326.1 spermidine synthase [Streptoalloteichus tenebrarius]BFE99091.1 polyamine aminopropyltransferase [Streptoalloteichus tenebrarius]
MSGLFPRQVVEPITRHEAHVHEVVEVLAHGRTAVQSYEIVRLGGYGRAMVIEGRVQSTEADEAIYHEALLLPAFVHAPRAERVLCLGGANGGMLPRIRALTEVREVVQVDVDRELYERSVEFLPHMHGDARPDPRCRVLFGDPRQVASTLPGRFDLVLADLPDSVDGTHVPRMFTAEFYGELSALLADGGVFATQAGPANPLDPTFLASVLRTARSVFRHAAAYTVSVPAFGIPWAFVVASDGVDPATLTAEDFHRRMALVEPGAARTYDWETHRHMFALPRPLREALTGNGRIIRDSEPLSVP